jgi:uncharacterized protein (UPF0264 family)
MMRLLISVRSVEEALRAAEGGADLIDLKEPGQGALGGLPLPTLAEIVTALRERGIGLPISATIGDLPMDGLDAILARVDAVGARGVDVVKVGIERAPGAGAVLLALASCGRPVVPVFIADRGLDQHVVARARTLGFPALMLDTAEKRAGSLFDALPIEVLEGFVRAAHKAGVAVGLAGALRVAHADRLAALAPDFAGFRSAVCRGQRSDALDMPSLCDLVVAMREAQATAKPLRSWPASA